MVNWIEAAALALIQGFSEFLPVSSSAHLVLPSQLLGWNDQGLFFDVVVHFGTLLAVFILFSPGSYQSVADGIFLKGRAQLAGRTLDDRVGDDACYSGRGTSPPVSFLKNLEGSL